MAVEVGFFPPLKSYVDHIRASDAREIVTDSEVRFSSGSCKNCPTCSVLYPAFLISLEQLKKIRTAKFHFVLTVTKPLFLKQNLFTFLTRFFIIFLSQQDTGYLHVVLIVVFSPFFLIYSFLPHSLSLIYCCNIPFF